MLVPYQWLLEYLQTDLPPAELAQKLTMSGLEVENIEEISGQAVLQTKVTANRGDMLSMVGVARHAAAALGTAWAPPQIKVAETGPRCEAQFAIEIEDPEGCPRYSARLIRDVEIGASPDWLQDRVTLAGMRPISNVVDATNLVMWELGQPLHAFDASLLRGQRIIVRRARAGEELLMIDESRRRLVPEDLVIADAERAVALAGVMGGAETEVSHRTIDVLLESAHFNPTSIRLTALRHGLTTEASYRFERFVDPSGTVRALDRAAQIIVETAGGEVAEGVIDVYPRPIEPRQVPMRPERANYVLGTDIAPEQMADYLQRLGFEVQRGAQFQVTVPTFRWDVEREIDLIEEVAQVHGYEKIPSTIPGLTQQSGRYTERQKLRRRVDQVLLQCGFNHGMSITMMSPRDFDRLNLPADHPLRHAVKLQNPIIEGQTIMRTTLLPASLEAVAHNARQRVLDVAIFETDKVFLPVEGQSLPHEQLRAVAVASGHQLTSAWNPGERPGTVDFFWMKGVAEELLAALNIPDVTWRRSTHPTFHPGRSAEALSDGRLLLTVGEAAASVLEAYELRQPAYLLDADLEAMLELARPVGNYQPLPRFPAADRDLALVVADDDDHSAASCEATIRQAAGNLLVSVRVFDEFRDPQRIGGGRKSLAFTLQFRAPDRTVTGEEVEAAMTAVHAAVQEQLGAEIRDW